MNAYDSDRMADLLAPLGYQTVGAPVGADLIILNTCHIREKAAEKVYSELGRLNFLKSEQAENGNKMLIAVAGCVAQAEGQQILERAPFVDLVFGPQTYHRLPEMVESALKSGARIVDTEFPVEDKFDFLPEQQHRGTVSQFLTIQEGCDRFCTFCVVPYTRGAEQSRSAASITADAVRMVSDGVREITLLGQNVNAWHGEAPHGGEWRLGRLVRHLADIQGLERIRYTTSHPSDMDDDLIAAHGDVPQLMPFLHLPVQSGADKVLSAMNRRHTADDYRRIIDCLRETRPDIALSSDFIVGFPGEDDSDFAATIKLVNEVGYAQAYSFKYSPRPGTPATDISQQVPDDIKSERLAGLQQLLRAQQDAFLKSQNGVVVEVLFEGAGRHLGQILGRSPYTQTVHVEAPGRLVGTLHKVRIKEILANSLKGDVVIGGGRGAQNLPAEGVCA